MRMVRPLMVAVLAALLLALLAACGGSDASPRTSPTDTPASAPVPTPTSVPIATPASTLIATPTATPLATLSVAPTLTPGRTSIAKETPAIGTPAPPATATRGPLSPETPTPTPIATLPPTKAPTPTAPATATATPGTEEPPKGVVIEIGPGSVARFLVREQFARVSFPNDAIGETMAVKGSLVFDADGRIVPAQSSITIDLSTLKSDEDERDEYLRTKSLETDRFPLATLTAQETPGLPWPLPSTGELEFQISGDLRLHGTSKPTVWEIKARFDSNTVRGQAKVNFPFAMFNIKRPRAFFLISVDDNIRLEMDFFASISPAS